MFVKSGLRDIYYSRKISRTSGEKGEIGKLNPLTYSVRLKSWKQKFHIKLEPAECHHVNIEKRKEFHEKDSNLLIKETPQTIFGARLT